MVDTENSPPSTPATASAPTVVEPVRSPLPRWTVPVVAVAVLGVTALVSVLLWRWVDGLAFADADKKSTAHLDVLKLAASIAVGGGGLFALYLAARRQRTQELELEKRTEELAQRERVQAHAEQVAEHNQQDAAARRVTELYSKSVEHLGSDKAAVRLGGMYALERLAAESTSWRGLLHPNDGQHRCRARRILAVGTTHHRCRRRSPEPQQTEGAVREPGVHLEPDNRGQDELGEVPTLAGYDLVGTFSRFGSLGSARPLPWQRRLEKKCEAGVPLHAVDEVRRLAIRRPPG